MFSDVEVCGGYRLNGDRTCREFSSKMGEMPLNLQSVLEAVSGHLKRISHPLFSASGDVIVLITDGEAVHHGHVGGDEASLGLESRIERPRSQNNQGMQSQG